MKDWVALQQYLSLLSYEDILLMGLSYLRRRVTSFIPSLPFTPIILLHKQLIDPRIRRTEEILLSEQQPGTRLKSRSCVVV